MILLVLRRKMHVQKYNPQKTLTRNFSKYVPKALKQDLAGINRDTILHINDLNTAWNKFKTTLTDIVNHHAPLKEKMIRGKPAPWLTLEIKTLMHQRSFLMKRTGKSKTATE